MLLVAIVVGAATAAGATGRITWSLLVSGTLVWSVVPIVQLFTGLLLVRGTKVSRRRALESYFSAHQPWSLWLLGVAAALLAVPNQGGSILYLAATFVIPAVVNIRLLLACCRRDLGLSRSAARSRVLVHQLVTAVVLVVYGAYAIAFIDRMSGS